MSFEAIKNFMNWPKKGVSNLSEFTAYLKSNWLSLLILGIGVLIVWLIIKKILSFIGGCFKD